MMNKIFFAAFASLALFTSSAIAQSNRGVLATGNLPQCARSCATLSESAQTCGGGSSSSQAIWGCFCQRVYSSSAALITSGTGLCADTCTSPTDQQAAISWFGTECGSDNGASEHPDNGSGSGSGSGAGSSTTTAAGSASTTGSGSSSTGSSGSSSSGDGNGITGTNPPTGDWWSNHWKWIVMLIVLAIALSILAALGVWLKKRHDRKQDKITSGFNAGITARSTGNQMRGPIDRMSDVPRQGPYANDDTSGSFFDASHAGPAGPGLEAGSGRASPMRTRDAFMPYGYGYTRSESKMGATGDAASPEPDMDEISRVPEDAAPAPPKKSGRRIMVRERSGNDSA